MWFLAVVLAVGMTNPGLLILIELHWNRSHVPALFSTEVCRVRRPAPLAPAKRTVGRFRDCVWPVFDCGPRPKQPGLQRLPLPTPRPTVDRRDPQPTRGRGVVPLPKAYLG